MDFDFQIGEWIHVGESAKGYLATAHVIIGPLRVEVAINFDGEVRIPHELHDQTLRDAIAVAMRDRVEAKISEIFARANERQRKRIAEDKARAIDDGRSKTTA